MKKLFVVFAVLALLVSVQAQNKFKLGVGLNVNLPAGSFGDVAGTGFGGTVQGELELAENIVGVGTIGYISYGGKDFGFSKYSYSMVPISVGVKYFFKPNLYAIGDLGYYNFSYDYEWTWLGDKVKESLTTSEFGIGLGAGYVMPISDNLDLDLTGKYIIISNTSSIDLRAGVKFSL